jgi:hypothetical protein
MMAAMASDIPGSEAWLRRRRARSLAIALGLGALVVIFYAATLVRLGPNALRKDGMSPPSAKGKSYPANDPAICKKAGTC